MSETFLPLVAATSKVRETGFTSLSSKALPVASPQVQPPTPEVCAKPTVTLQKNGEIVSGIRVQCGCGQVVELTCVY